MANTEIPLKTLRDRTGLDIPTANRYYKIQNTVIEMLKDRGFIIPADEEKSVKKLNYFYEYIYKKKLSEDVVYLMDLLNELMQDKIINPDYEDRIEDFVSEYGPELVEKLDAKEITDKIVEVFKVSTKQARLLEDSVNEGVNARKDLKAVEVLNQIYKKPDGELILTYYFYNSEDLKKESKRRINDIVLDLLNIQKKNKTLKNIIFISESKLNTVMIDDLKKYKEKMNITMFMGDYLLFNCTKHFLVPKHHLMSEEEQKEFLKDNKEKNFLQRLPKIFDTDPVARYYGAVPGQMFKIIRESLQDDLLVRYSEFYRYVVPEVKK
jgi:DNA-directed RNA polymerase subunit H (RpoH/RPB5)/predicted transcriptional regulator